jgi:hypothetical protein
VDRSDDMRVFAKVVERSSFAGAAAQHCRQKAAAPSVISTAAWRKASDASSRNRRYVTKAQESQYRPPHTEGVAYKQPACATGSRSCSPRWQRAVRC